MPLLISNIRARRCTSASKHLAENARAYARTRGVFHVANSATSPVQIEQVKRHHRKTRHREIATRGGLQSLRASDGKSITRNAPSDCRAL